MTGELSKIQSKIIKLPSPNGFRLEYLLFECSAAGIVHTATREDWKGSEYQKLAREVIEAMYKEVHGK